MVHIEVSYCKADDEKKIYAAIQKLDTKFKTVKICKEYRNKKGYNVVSVKAE